MQHTPMTFTDRLRRVVSGIVTPLGQFLHRMGISPDTITVIGLFLVAIGAWRIAEGEFNQAFIILVLSLPFDTIDGAVARASGLYRPIGSYLDSTLDRYADGLLMGGIGLYYAQLGEFEFTAIAMVALHGSLMVSYNRAKAESLNIDCKIGLFTRVERLLTLLVTWVLYLIIGRTGVDVGIIVLAVGTQFTALQRMVYVARRLPPAEKLEG